MGTNKYNVECVENGRKVVYEMSLEERIEYELALLDGMGDETIYRFYHVDSREQAQQGIIEYWRFIA